MAVIDDLLEWSSWTVESDMGRVYKSWWKSTNMHSIRCTEAHGKTSVFSSRIWAPGIGRDSYRSLENSAQRHVAEILHIRNLQPVEIYSIYTVMLGFSLLLLLVYRFRWLERSSECIVLPSAESFTVRNPRGSKLTEWSIEDITAEKIKKLSISEVVHDIYLYTSFLAYLKSIYSSENLLCLRAMSVFHCFWVDTTKPLDRWNYLDISLILYFWI